MKARVTVGIVDLRLEGLDLTYEQVRQLMIEAGALSAKADPPTTKDATDELPTPPPVGFNAPILERSAADTDL